ncbi:MAG: HAMP domain-containing protein [Thiohalomonadaceae bacterium]
MRRLTAAVRAVEGGDLQQRVAVESGDEVGELARAFNRMSAELARSSKN